MHTSTIKQSLLIGLLIAATSGYAQTGVLRLTTDLGDAQIFLNGERVRNSPMAADELFELTVPAILYTVTAKKIVGADYFYGQRAAMNMKEFATNVPLKLNKVVFPQDYGQQPNGSVTLAGREWLRCAIGQVWNGKTCLGQAGEYLNEMAKDMVVWFNRTGYAGKSDWRLPTVRELASLRTCSDGFEPRKIDIHDGAAHINKSCSAASDEPALDAKVFPNAQATKPYWSNSTYTDYPNILWAVHFEMGRVEPAERGFTGLVRLVRNKL